jgi:hypothetical protein
MAAAGYFAMLRLCCCFLPLAPAMPGASAADAATMPLPDATLADADITPYATSMPLITDYYACRQAIIRQLSLLPGYALFSPFHYTISAISLSPDTPPPISSRIPPD